MTAILGGIRILDLTSIVSGPFATMQLADLGADVIRIEAPGGDLYRAAPPARNPGMGVPWMTINRGKRSVGVDLHTRAGQEVLRRLARSADVAVHNIRPDAARRLGVDAVALTAHNPRLIHCTTTGFGSDGPDADLPAYDDIIQARSGIAALLADDGDPRLVPTILADKVTGLHVANAILAALLHRERTDEVLTVEVPMLEVMAAFVMAEHMGGHGLEPPVGPPGYNRLLSPHRRPHATADGHLVVMPYTGRHWAVLLGLLTEEERGALDVGPWLDDADQRAARIDELYALLSRALPHRDTATWLAVLTTHGIPVGRVNDLEGLLSDPHLTAVGMFPVTDHPSESAVRTPRHPVRYDGRAPRTDAPAPRGGADTEAVLGSLGFDADQVATMVSDQAVWSTA